MSSDTQRPGIFGLLLAVAVVSQPAAIATAATTPATTQTTTPKPPPCPYSSCKCFDDTIDCSGKNLNRIPTLTRRYTAGYYVKLDLSNNRISSISDNTLPANITHLDLGGNPIRSISSGAFAKSVDTLKQLRFSKSAFKEFPKALEKLNALESLELSENNLTTWTADVLKHLGHTLKTLDISNTAQTKWPEWIKYLPSLRRISLSGNPIKTIASGIFEEWENRLEHLDLSNTGISTVDFLAELFSLQSLDLSQNIISNHVYFSYHLISLYRSLKSLNISHNRFSTTPRLAHLTSLTELDIANNSLSTFERSSFPISLRTLILDYNRISSLPEYIMGMKSLYHLSIRYNRLKSVSVDSFPYSGNNLKTLMLTGNPIEDISVQSFFLLTRLLHLDLSATKIEELPLALSSLRALTELRMENIPDLLCWCDVNLLSNWYNSKKSHLNVVGSCGNEPISTFLENFAENCGQ